MTQLNLVFQVAIMILGEDLSLAESGGVEMKSTKKSKVEPSLQKNLDLKVIPNPIIKYPNIRRNYPKLIKKDLRLGEVLRVGNPRIPLEQKKLNPFHVKVSRKGRIWVDIMLERKPGVRIHDLKRIMHVYGRPGRGRFVSGRVRIERLPELNKLSVRLQTGRPVAPLAAEYYSVKEIEADQSTLAGEPGLQGIDGTGVIIGFVDEGCDFNHVNFKVNNETRLLYLWDQNGRAGDHPKNYEYGTEHTRCDINMALSTSKPYETLNYTPARNAHGTHVMDIAAGSPPKENEDEDPKYVGVAPNAELIFVELRQPAKQTDITNEELVQWQLNTLGSSHDLLDAVRYIFERAKDKKKPAVVNLSLGANGGAHNGTSLLESAFDDLLTEPDAKYGRAIVIGAGNEFDTRLHTSGRVTPAGPKLIKWRIPKLASLSTIDIRQELEIWYPKGTALKIELLDPENNLVDGLLCRFGEICTSHERSVIPIWTIKNAEADPAIDQRNNHIEILVDNHHPDFQEGVWTFRLSHDETHPGNDDAVLFHAWIECNQQRSIDGQASNNTTGSLPPSRFAADSESSTTINGIANARLPIVVGACNRSFVAAYFTSAGPSLNPDVRCKPELYAPGQSILSAEAMTQGRSSAMGTSMAAPHVTGVIALMFQKALSLDPPRTLTMQQISKILTDTASDKQRTYHPRLGFGRVNGRKALRKISKTP